MPHCTLDHQAEINGTKVPVMNLEIIDYGRLVNKEPKEIKKLLDAASMPGFFHLDLNDEPTGGFLPCLRDIYAISEEYFTPGENQATFEMKLDDTISNTLNYPGSLAAHSSKTSHFGSLSHSVNKTLLSTLSSALGLDLESSHRDDAPSETALNLIYSPAKHRLADAPDTTHTDTGTLTSLFCDKWGIQIEHPQTKEWGFVEPKPGCALVNVADSLQRMSGGRLWSCRHRHTQPVDGFERRYFVVAYLRPAKGQ